MSDLSSPPLSLVPLDPAQAEAFAWPTPPTPGFPAPVRQTEIEPCEIEGPNGRLNQGLLHAFDATLGLAHVQVPPSRNLLALRPTQFRRLTLTRALLPLAPPGGAAFDSTTPLLPQRTVSQIKLRYKDGSEQQVASIGKVETSLGLFTFTPVDATGRVLRNFYPRQMLAAGAIGPRIGEVLVDQQATTPARVEDAAAEQSKLRSRKIGDILVTQQIVTPEQLLVAIDQQAKMPMVRIGEALQALGFVSEAKLTEALRLQASDRSLPLGELLVRRGDVTRMDLQSALARKMGYPIVDVDAFPVEPEGVARLPLLVARRLNALPLMMRGGRLVVALEDPSARQPIDEIEFIAQCKVLPVLARAGSLVLAIERVYTRQGQDSSDAGKGPASNAKGPDHEQVDHANRLLANLEQQSSNELRDGDTLVEQSDNALVRLLNTMILDAHSKGVSDIHIECHPGQEKVRVRFRKDGVLRPYLELPASYRQALVSRIKIMCDLDSSERRKPQDGKLSFGRWVQGETLELRVATIPTAHNLEDVVLRLLATARALPLDRLGLQPETLAQLKSVIGRPHGLVLCVGPTGSGKTTTLHAALAHINSPGRKIWTAEDPVEISQPGLRQVQINPKIDWTFAKALRAFLHADPDVVMVGEIRDSETAQMAVEASLTGHLVLSTLHTHSAPECVTRLLDRGIDPFSLADSLLAVLAQRLVRAWCPHCVVAQPASADALQSLLDEYLQCYPDTADRPDRDSLRAEWQQRHGIDGVLHLHHAAGCAHCDYSGFAGRLGLHELLVVSQALRGLIQAGARAAVVQSAAMREGMRTLRQDGIVKVLAGLTSIAEVRAISTG